MPDFSRRSTAPELMDTEAVPYEEFRACLVDLARINVWTLAAQPTLDWLARVLKEQQRAEPIRILDVGSGQGDMLRAIARWAARRGYRVDLIGLDLNPWSKSAAEEATPSSLPIRYITGDVFVEGVELEADLIISSLFTHHLFGEDLVRFMRWMEGHARIGWFINDLHRHRLPYHVVKHATQWLGLHYMCVHDAPVSVARGFTRQDWDEVLNAAGIPPDQVRIDWFFPFRWGVGRMK